MELASLPCARSEFYSPTPSLPHHKMISFQPTHPKSQAKSGKHSPGRTVGNAKIEQTKFKFGSRYVSPGPEVGTERFDWWRGWRDRLGAFL